MASKVVCVRQSEGGGGVLHKIFGNGVQQAIQNWTNQI